jgi:pimeloyl-ACP methyl ester carboxylesterase
MRNDRMKAANAEPEIVPRNGKPISVIVPIKKYQEMIIPARLLLERRNVVGSQLRVVDFSKFRGKPVLVLTGTNDLGHARAVDEPIAAWLNANGAEADFIYLGDFGITGNGHMLMLERNSDALAQLIIDWIES